MITVAVLGILAAFAVPSMTDFYDRKRLVSQTEAISNLLQFGRSEAIKVSTGLISVTFNRTPPWFMGLSNGTAGCTNAATCVISEGAASVTRHLTATECPNCSLAITEDTPTGAAKTSLIMVFDLRGMVSQANVDGGGLAMSAHDYFMTLTSPKNKKLSLSIGKLGRITICSPAGKIANYPSCT